MTKLIDPMLISAGDKLTEKEGGATVTVTEVTKADIAWFIKVPDGGVFGECSRSKASSIFKNVAACKPTNTC